MRRKLTISIDDKLYKTLYRNVGAGRIAKFIADSVRPRLNMRDTVLESYKQMAKDKDYMRDAMEWIEGNIDDGLPPGSEKAWNK